MASYGWMINLTGSSIPVYEMGTQPTTRIGTITPNECFADGQIFRHRLGRMGFSRFLPEYRTSKHIWYS